MGTRSEKARRNGERGSYTVEAALALSIFIIAFVALINVVTVITCESRVQYALDMAAKETARCCYAVDRLLGVGGDRGTLAGDLINAASSFSELVYTSGTSGGGTDLAAEIGQKAGSAAETYRSVSAVAGQITEALEQSNGSISDAVALLAGDLMKDGLRRTAGRLAGNVAARIAVPKYIAEDPDSWLENCGVVGGLGGLDFGLSSVLFDGKTVRIAAVYRIRLAGLGVFNSVYRVCQCAETHAWLASEDPVEAGPENTVWSKTAFERGRFFVREFKDRDRYHAVKEGTGIDLYDPTDGVVTAVHSLNVFSNCYSVYTPVASTEGKGADSYKLTYGRLKSEIKGWARDLASAVSKRKGGLLEMESGVRYKLIRPEELRVLMVLPAEADRENYELLLSRIAEQILQETGVVVEYEYEYNALD